MASGALRSGGFAKVDRLLTEAIDRGHHYLVLDLDQVDGIEPEALGMLWVALRGIHRRGATLAAAGARPALGALGSGGLRLYDSVPAALSCNRYGGDRS